MSQSTNQGPSQISASGTIRVQAAREEVVLNVFGTYANLDEDAFNDLMDALEEAGEAAGFSL